MSLILYPHIAVRAVDRASADLVKVAANLDAVARYVRVRKLTNNTRLLMLRYRVGDEA